jgi:hypothetical protein
MPEETRHESGSQYLQQHPDHVGGRLLKIWMLHYLFQHIEVLSDKN